MMMMTMMTRMQSMRYHPGLDTIKTDCHRFHTTDETFKEFSMDVLDYMWPKTQHDSSVYTSPSLPLLSKVLLGLTITH